jgi:hypothetical protein
VSKFNVGDRVAHRDDPGKCGTITAVIRSEPDTSGGIYAIDWDAERAGVLGQGLIRHVQEAPP